MEECAMTNTRATSWPSTHYGEPLPVPGDESGPFELVSVETAASGTALDAEFGIAGTRTRVHGTGPERITAFADAARRAGVRVGVPIREVHDWDGATGTVTSYIRCVIEGREVAGAGIARERGEATMRAMIAAANAAFVHTEALIS